MREFISNYPQRGLVIVISDFLDDEGCEKPLQYLADFGHELLLIQVWADEDAAALERRAGTVDAETGQPGEAAVRRGGARAATPRRSIEYCGALQKIAVRNGGRYVGVSTAMPLEDVISVRWCARRDWSERGR